MARRPPQQIGLVAHTAVHAQVNYETLQDQARARSLTILGGFHPTEEDRAPAGCQTLFLLGPDEPAFWPTFTASPEWQDGRADPMDRWSTRVIGAWANALGAEGVYPFGGPPYQPFFSWATRTGRIHVSPILLLVHDTAGLFVSFRGALSLPYKVDMPNSPANPCDFCADKPCRTTCPVDAFDGSSYDVDACKVFLDSSTGEDCMKNGCAARRACPVSRRFARLPKHSAYHMSTFKG